MLKKNKISKYIIFLLITICILLILSILYRVNNKYKTNNKFNNKLSFEDIPSINIQPQSGCTVTPGDVSGICTNYTSCCPSSGSSSNACICNHPVVQQCQTEYNTCMNDSNILKIYTTEQRSKKCAAQVKDCCVPYDEIAIDSSKFEPPIKQDQKQDLICSLQGSNNMNITQKCMELCQVYPNCAAYNIQRTNLAAVACNLFSSVGEATIDPLSGKPSANTLNDYYVKK